MQYVAPSQMDKGEIVRVVRSSRNREETISAALSAVYFHDTEFAGETLLDALRAKRFDCMMPFFRIVQTYMQMHRTIIYTTISWRS